MSLHRSLKTKSGALNQHRNVLTRAERIAKLTDEERFSPEKNSALGVVARLEGELRDALRSSQHVAMLVEGAGLGLEAGVDAHGLRGVRVSCRVRALARCLNP